MIKLIASDLDETLLCNAHEISKQNLAAIAQAQAAGVHFVPATGRGFISVSTELKTLGLYQKPGEYVISFNGGAVVENKNNKLISCSPLDFEQANALWEAGVTRKLCMHVYTLDEVWVRSPTKDERIYAGSRMDIKETSEVSLAFLRKNPILKVLYHSLDMGYLKTIEHEITDITAGLDISYSANRYLEFNPGGVNKGHGLLTLGHHLGIQPHETMAIGDSTNDLEMLKAAGVSVAVANASSEVKAVCDYVCSNSYKDSAVAEAIERFVLV